MRVEVTASEQIGPLNALLFSAGFAEAEALEGRMSCPFSHNSNYSSLDGRLFRASGADSTHRVQQTRTGSIGGIVPAAEGPALGRGPAHMSSSTRLTLTGQEAFPTHAANPTLTGTPDCAPPVAQPSYPQCGLYPETGPDGDSPPPGR